MEIYTNVYSAEAYMHKRTHTCAHACTHVYIHTYSQSLIPADLSTCTHKHTHTHTHTLFIHSYTYRASSPPISPHGAHVDAPSFLDSTQRGCAEWSNCTQTVEMTCSRCLTRMLRMILRWIWKLCTAAWRLMWSAGRFLIMIFSE